MNSFTGTIVEAGSISGTTRVIIETTEFELRRLKELPLYTPVKITLERISENEQSDVNESNHFAKAANLRGSYMVGETPHEIIVHIDAQRKDGK